MEYNVIATDLDGTLLTSNKKVTERTKNVLNLLKNKGFFILGITARNLSSVKGVVDINLFDYLILNNGSDIYDINRNTVELVIASMFLNLNSILFIWFISSWLSSIFLM